MKGLRIFYPAFTFLMFKFIDVHAANDETNSPDAA
jgi:hypothetical protein